MGDNVVPDGLGRPPGLNRFPVDRRAQQADVIREIDGSEQYREVHLDGYSVVEHSRRGAGENRSLFGTARLVHGGYAEAQHGKTVLQQRR